jgi:outer membrane protein assembly factor BamB
MVPAGLLALLLVCLLSGPLTQAASAEALWTTYHRDPTRSGFDPEATVAITPALAWHSQDLGAPIWSQPLIVGSRVYVATVNDDIYALEAGSGAVIWGAHVGTPVPDNQTAEGCGDITPTVGIVGTPVIDTANQAIYAVADTWNASTKEVRHVLVGLNLASGAQVLRTAVDPPGEDPKALLQRTALNLDQGRVIFGYGGNDGDCSEYRGSVVSAPESGGAASYWQDPISLPSKAGGAIWATAGPAVGPEGNIFATTGNPVPPSGQKAGPYDYSDSVVELNSSLQVAGNFKPPNWEEEGNNDLDLSSAGAELLPGGLLFQAGKDGKGYLVNEATMAGGVGAVYGHEVCGGQGSFGGDAYAGGVIYIPCTSGVQALAYNQAARTFTPLWQGPSDAFGPPIVSAGLVWDIQTGGFSGGGTKLYGLDPATGKARYTLALPSPVADHFGSPSAAGGMLFLATGSTETAFHIAELAPGAGGGAPGHVLTQAIDKNTLLVPTLLHTRLTAGPKGHVRVALRCVKPTGKCKGAVTLRAKFVVSVRVHKKLVHRTILVGLSHAPFNHAKGSFAVIVRLGPKARTILHRHHGRLALQIVITAPPGKARKVAGSLVATR